MNLDCHPSLVGVLTNRMFRRVVHIAHRRDTFTQYADTRATRRANQQRQDKQRQDLARRAAQEAWAP
eukprot:8458468-Alexandrium_andersonii.AAC.1